MKNEYPQVWGRAWRIQKSREWALPSATNFLISGLIASQSISLVSLLDLGLLFLWRIGYYFMDEVLMVEGRVTNALCGLWGQCIVKFLGDSTYTAATRNEHVKSKNIFIM